VPLRTVNTNQNTHEKHFVKKIPSNSRQHAAIKEFRKEEQDIDFLIQLELKDRLLHIGSGLYFL